MWYFAPATTRSTMPTRLHCWDQRTSCSNLISDSCGKEIPEMHKVIRSIVIAGLSMPLFLAAQTASNVTLPQDKGPNSINVSAYPAEQQKGYKVFADKCAKCQDRKSTRLNSSHL